MSALLQKIAEAVEAQRSAGYARDQAIITAHEAGEKVSEIAAAARMSQATIFRLVKSAKDGGDGATSVTAPRSQWRTILAETAVSLAPDCWDSPGGQYLCKSIAASNNPKVQAENMLKLLAILPPAASPEDEANRRASLHEVALIAAFLSNE